MDNNQFQMMIGLLIGICALIFMVIRTKIHAFPALIIAASLTGIIGGMAPPSVVSSITKGFGNTLSSIGIIIGFGVMMGQLFELSGAAERMALTFIKIFGKKREDIALAVTGAIVSVPIFCDSGFILLSSLARAISGKTKKTIFILGPALAVGLVTTHHMVAPTPGPLAAADNFGANLGLVILWGLIFSVPMVAAALLYIRIVLGKTYQLPEGVDGWKRFQTKPEIQDAGLEPSRSDLPSNFIAFFPILLPVFLILISTGINPIKNVIAIPENVLSIVAFAGNPVIAVGLGLLVAIATLTNNMTKDETLKAMELGIRGCGIILLVTGAGGALGQVLRDSGSADSIAQILSNANIPPILLPFFVATIVRFIQGSGTVSMVTASAICAPIILPLGASPVFSTLAACVGSMFFGYFNDSYFWVVNRVLGIDKAKEQIKTWSITTTVAWATGFVVLIISNALFGKLF